MGAAVAAVLTYILRENEKLSSSSCLAFGPGTAQRVLLNKCLGASMNYVLLLKSEAYRLRKIIEFLLVNTILY
jgi:hypothetical protein